MADLWTYRRAPTPDLALEGFTVEATDGSIGSIDEATYDVDASFIVVDTGPWIFGRKVLLPAGVIDEIDLDKRQVYINRTKEEIRNAPQFDPDMGLDPDRREEFDRYYGRM